MITHHLSLSIAAIFSQRDINSISAAEISRDLQGIFSDASPDDQNTENVAILADILFSMSTVTINDDVC